MRFPQVTDISVPTLGARSDTPPAAAVCEAGNFSRKEAAR